MKENLKLGGILLVITMVAGILLGLTNEFTKEQIMLNSRVNMSDLAAIMEGADGIQELELEPTDEVSEIFEVYSGKDMIGYALKVSSKGFKGPIDFVVGISKDDKITGIKVLSHSETPGLGSRIEEDSFTSKFIDKSIEVAFEAVKSAGVKHSEIEAIAGATISSRGTIAAVNTAVRYYKEKVKGEEVAQEPEKVEMSLEEKLVATIDGADIANLEGENPAKNILKYYSIKNGEEELGYGIVSKAEGYYADIEFAVILDVNGIVKGLEVLRHEETEGLGSLITEEEYRNQFIGKSVDNNLKLSQGAPSDESEIEGVSSATYSSTASIKAVNEAFKFFKNNIGLRN